MSGLAVIAWGLAAWLAGAPRVWADAPLSVDGSALAEAVAVDLTVVPLEGWRRSQWFDETGLPWVDPSPNIPIGWRGLLYAGIGLLEATNASVGRGTGTPFELVGAPWITDPSALADSLNGLGLPGVRFDPARFTPIVAYPEPTLTRRRSPPPRGT